MPPLLPPPGQARRGLPCWLPIHNLALAQAAHQLALAAAPCLQMFGGLVRRYKHQSAELGCDMFFTVFHPPAAASGSKVPVSR